MSIVPLVLPDRGLLARAVAARLARAVVRTQATCGAATLVLTGGTIAIEAYEALRDSSLCSAVNWALVNIWWGDERFLPSGDPERNETQARAALLDALPLDPARVHPMPPSDGPDGPDPEAAAARYARALAMAAAKSSATTASDGALPQFDVLLLGVGEDGHIASIFPNHPIADSGRTVAAVTGSPKPPPTRLTLTMAAINTSDEIWFIAAGAGKATAVSTAIAQATPAGPADMPARSADISKPLPASLAHGTIETVWMIDQAAAGGLGGQGRPRR